MIAMGRSGLLDEVGDDQIFGNVDDALNRARRELGLPEEEPPQSAIPTVERERGLTPATGHPAVNPELLRKRDGHRDG